MGERRSSLLAATIVNHLVCQRAVQLAVLLLATAGFNLLPGECAGKSLCARYRENSRGKKQGSGSN
jgi:hypothetical protein